jgi:hypothetical protein
MLGKTPLDLRILDEKIDLFLVDGQTNAITIANGRERSTYG